MACLQWWMSNWHESKKSSILLFKSRMACTLHKFCRNTPAKPDVPEEPARSVLSGRRILLVEDNELNREIAAELLQMQGLTVDMAENGQLALTHSFPGCAQSPKVIHRHFDEQQSSRNLLFPLFSVKLSIIGSKRNHLLFLNDFGVPSDNNMSERDLRKAKNRQVNSWAHRLFFSRC